jgi:hypothetical protein
MCLLQRTHLQSFHPGYTGLATLTPLEQGLTMDTHSQIGTPPVTTANCIIIDLFSAFEPGLVALFLTLPLKNG